MKELPGTAIDRKGDCSWRTKQAIVLAWDTITESLQDLLLPPPLFIVQSGLYHTAQLLSVSLTLDTWVGGVQQQAGHPICLCRTGDAKESDADRYFSTQTDGS